MAGWRQFTDLFPNGVYQRGLVDIPDADNAYLPWARASDLCDCIKGAAIEKVYFDCFDGDMLPRPLDHALRKDIQSIVLANQTAVEFLEEGIAKPEFQIPDALDIDESQKASITTGFRRVLTALARIKYLKAQILIREHQYTAGCRDAIDLCLMGVKMGSGNGGCAFFADGVLVHKLGLALLLQLLREHASHPTELLGLVGTSLGRVAPRLEHFVRAAFSGFWQTVLSSISRVEDSMGVGEILNVLLSDAPLRTLIDPNASELTDGARSSLPVQSWDLSHYLLRSTNACSDTLFGLLRNHAAPFEKGQTIRRMMADFWEVHHGLERSARELRASVSTMLSRNETLWPAGFPSLFRSCVALPTDHSRIAQLRTRVGEAANPLGELVVRDILRAIRVILEENAFWWFSIRLSVSVLRIVWAIHTYRASRGAMPEDLQDAITEGHLDFEPVDPFSGKPFRYCPDQLVLTATDAHAELSHWGVFQFAPVDEKRFTWPLRAIG